MLQGGLTLKNYMKHSKAGLIISVLAIIIASISFAYSRIEGMPSWTSGIILFCTIAIFFSNLEIYKSQKNKENTKTLNS